MKEFIKKNPPRFFFLVVLGFCLISLIGALGIYLYKNLSKNNIEDGDVIAIVNGKKIYTTDLNEMIYGIDFSGSPESPNSVDHNKKVELVKQLIEWEIAKQEAKKLGISLSDQDYKKEAIIRLGQDVYDNFDTSFTEIQKNIIRKTISNEALITKIRQAVTAQREGGLILARFDMYADQPPQNLTKSQIDEWYKTREIRYQEDKMYAKKVIDDIYKKLQEKQITFDQAIEITQNDNKLNATHFLPWTVDLSQKFNFERFSEGGNILSREDIRRTIISLKENEFSEIKTAQVFKSNGEAVDGFYYIAFVTARKGGDYLTYDDWYQEKYQNYKIQIIQKEFKDLASKEELISLKKALDSFKIKKIQAHSINGTYVHACGTSPTTYANHWGINSGSTSSTAGLVVYTQYYNSSGNGPYALNGVSVTVRDGDGNSNSKNVRYTPAGNNSSGENSHTFTSGEGFYRTGGNANVCDPNGYVVLGYGTTPSDSHANWGNGYSLDCDGNDFTVSVTNPSGRTGHWDDSSKSVRVTNGSTPSQIKFTWRDNRPPLPRHVSPANNHTFTLAQGATTTRVDFVGKATDADNDSVKISIAYQRQNADGSWGGWTYLPSAGVYTELFNQNTDITAGSADLGAGLYRWRIRANDEHGTSSPPGEDGNYFTYDGDWYFTINPAVVIPPLSCTVTPQTGLAPLVVSVSVSGGGSPYDFDFDSNGTYELNDRNNTTVYWTYPSAGTYTVKVRDNNNTITTCSPNVVQVNDPTSPGGGEVAP